MTILVANLVKNNYIGMHFKFNTSVAHILKCEDFNWFQFCTERGINTTQLRLGAIVTYVQGISN